MRAVIIGAGIGGLAAAVALRRVGIESVVVERATTIREVGAGIALWSNAVNALRQIGVEDRVLASASVIERNAARTLAGRPLGITDLTGIARVAGAPNICVHRGVLQRILLEALPADVVRTGARCVAADDSAAVLDDGERIEADFLVAADGIASAIRAQLHGAEPPRYAGYTCWRGIVRAKDIIPENSALLAAGRGSQFGIWPCGAEQYYWFLTRNAAEGAPPEHPLDICGKWAAPIPEIVQATPKEAILQHDIYDRPPLREWGRGKVTLLGDAAHATTPNLGQGACLALEDAVVLAHCLGTIQPVERALREYERRRIPRTSAVVRNSWQTGRLLQLDHPGLESARDWFMGSSLGQYLGQQTLAKLLTWKVPELSPQK